MCPKDRLGQGVSLLKYDMDATGVRNFFSESSSFIIQCIGIICRNYLNFLQYIYRLYNI